MRLRFDQLAGHLGRQLAPLYLICGDEPHQLGEACRLVRERARAKGFGEREILDQQGSFDWNLLAATASARSLFATRRLIELRIGSATLGKEGSAAVRAWCERPPPDDLLLMIAPGLDRKDLQSQWAKAVETAGVLVQVWPLKERELERWLHERLLAAGFRPEPEVAPLLAGRVEGNLLAAVQEIEKLSLLRDPGPLSVDDLLDTLTDSARFDLFALTDAALAGDRARVARVLAGLRAEGTAEILALWALARELRMLAEAAAALAGGASPLPVFERHRVPRARLERLERALPRLSRELLLDLLRHCLRVDQSIKGLAPGDPWHRLAAIADRLAAGRGGAPLPWF